MALGTILWVDDEIESLQSHILFLKNKGYEVNAMTNGLDAIDFVKENQVDVVLLDETMPGISGLETLAKITSDVAGVARWRRPGGHRRRRANCEPVNGACHSEQCPRHRAGASDPRRCDHHRTCG